MEEPINKKSNHHKLNRGGCGHVYIVMSENPHRLSGEDDIL